MVMMVPGGAAVVVARYIGPLGNDGGGDTQAGGVIVLVLLADALYGGDKEHADHQHKHDGEHHTKRIKA